MTNMDFVLVLSLRVCLVAAVICLGASLFPAMMFFLTSSVAFKMCQLATADDESWF